MCVCCCPSSSALVDFNDTVNLTNEPKACHKANGTGQEEKQKHHNQRVAKVQKCGGSIFNRQFGRKVMTTIDEQIDGRKAGCQK